MKYNLSKSQMYISFDNKNLPLDPACQVISPLNVEIICSQASN